MSGQKKQWPLSKIPVMCQSDTGGVLRQTWNRQQSRSVQKPKQRAASSASNSQATHALWSSGKSGITLPKPNREVHKSHVASSSSSSRNNKGSREQDGYHIPTAPAGSYRDDDTGPSPKTLLTTVSGMKSAVNHFAKVLIADINKHPMELEYLKQSILDEMHFDVDRPNHWKFLVQAFVCKRLFEGFSAPNGYFDLEDFQTDRMSTLVSFADFTKFKDKATSISMLMDLDTPDASFLGRFCFKKFKSICGEVASDLPLPVYQVEWSYVARRLHPKTEFYQNFLKAAVSVWLMHRLAHSFDQKVELLSYEKGFTFQRETMESVIPGGYEEGNEENDVNIEVCFSVIPGFQVNRSVVKCEVYLRDKVSLPPMETSIEKTHLRTSNSKTPVKSLSHKTPGLKSHTPEMTVRDNNAPESLRTSERFSSYSNHPTILRPKIGDSVRSAPEVKAANIYWNGHRESLSPGNQGIGSRSGRKGRNEQESFTEAHTGSDKRDTTVYRMPASQSSSSSQRAPNYAARHTKLSESRRVANVRQPPRG